MSPGLEKPVVLKFAAFTLLLGPVIVAGASSLPSTRNFDVPEDMHSGFA
jgi:hypothetical protein